jgi:dipeptidase D
MLALMDEAQGLSRGLEFLFTVDEETGLTGAQGLGPDLLTGDTLLNLDTEEEGALYVGCAGGLDLDAYWRFSRVPRQDPKLETFRLEVSGLKGGHSGIDIDKQRGNAVKLLAYVLDQLLAFASEGVLQVISLDGGKARNAIPREAVALVAIHREAKEHLIEQTKELESKLNQIYKEADPQLKISLSPHPAPTVWPPIDPHVAKKWLKAIVGFPSQPYRFELGIAGLVRTSSNLGVVETEKNQITIRSKLRSSSDLELEVLKKELTTVLELADGQVKGGGGYCGWQPDLQSSLLGTAQAVHTEVFGHKAEVKAIHAGLECGLIGSRYPKMKMISFGPHIINAHSPDEAVEVASVDRFWTYLKALVQRLQKQTRILSD